VIKKKKLINIISKKIGDIEEVLSVSFVGSFLKKNFFSDIDIVIITKKISKKIINKCHQEIKEINFESLGTNKKILINDTFGPLKFNTEKNLVLHLMIYSYEDHVNHVINSPFTCYDWERTKASYGLNLKDLYPVLKIFSSDLLMKNRGLKAYRKNLENRTINYQKYIFKKEKVITKKLNFKIIGKDIAEFCYHVIFFSIKNYLKYHKQKNKDFSLKEINNFIKKISNSKKSNEMIIFFKLLINFKKKQKIYINQKKIIDQTLNFLDLLEAHIKAEEKNCIKLQFKRHFKTRYDKKIFIGQKINPQIIKDKYISKKKYDIAFTSPSIRSLQTSKLFSKKQKINKNLKEIDYGNAEGLTYAKLKKKYPLLIKNWGNKRDTNFPNGECSKDVSLRAIKFINFLKKTNLNNKKYLIVTHNVFLRCLLGKYFQIPIHKWFLINIDYGENINFNLLNNKLFINITRNKFKKLFKKVYENSISN
jgi:ribonuclease H / adenosylcobalamin/alpha-ribazole phosphatase